MTSRHIILIGPMGSGKSTIGAILARSLALQLYDLDHLIEKSAGADIPWIFEKEGEQGFRQRETKALAATLQKPSAVIATGGGIVTQSENRLLMQKVGFVVYLSASVDAQYQRTYADKNRPMLSGDDPKNRLAKLFEQRREHYSQLADFSVETDILSVNQIVEAIVNRLEEIK